MIGNGTLHYDHDRDGTLSQVAGCSVSVLLENTLWGVGGRAGQGGTPILADTDTQG